MLSILLITMLTSITAIKITLTAITTTKTTTLLITKNSTTNNNNHTKYSQMRPPTLTTTTTTEAIRAQLITRVNRMTNQ